MSRRARTGDGRRTDRSTSPILLFVWWIAYFFTLVDQNLLPSPFATLRDAAINIVTGDVVADLTATLIRITYAFAIAAVVGVPLGIVLGASDKVYRSVEFIMVIFARTAEKVQ